MALTPGPVKIPARVARRLADPPLAHHREEGFRELYAQIVDDVVSLLGVPASDYGVAIMTATGTGAIEACLLTLAPLGPGVIVSNGYFGDRAIDQAVATGVAHHSERLAHDRPLDPQRVADLLDRHRDARWLFFVSHETRVGLKNPMEAIASSAHSRGVFTAVDVISSAFAYPLDLARSKADLFVATSAKGVLAAPGLGVFLLHRGGAERLAACSGRPRTYYLDIVSELEAQTSTRQPRFAQPVVLFSALSEACAHLREIGIDAHMGRIQRQMGRFIDALAAASVHPLLEEGYRSNVVVNFALPQGWTYPQVAGAMRREGYFVSYGIPGDTSHVQLSTIGDLSDAEISGATAALLGILGGRP